MLKSKRAGREGVGWRVDCVMTTSVSAARASP